MQVEPSVLGESYKGIVRTDEIARGAPDCLMACFVHLSLLGKRSVEFPRRNSNEPSAGIRRHDGVDPFNLDEMSACPKKRSPGTLNRLGSKLVLDIRELVDEHPYRVYQVSWPGQREILVFDASDCLPRQRGKHFVESFLIVGWHPAPIVQEEAEAND